MIAIKMETEKGIGYYPQSKKQNCDALYEAIYSLTNEKEATKATLWAKSASIGEEYEHRLFKLTVK